MADTSTSVQGTFDVEKGSLTVNDLKSIGWSLNARAGKGIIVICYISEAEGPDFTDVRVFCGVR